MTPEQKARFLYTDMFAITVDDYCAKQCALRAVDEIISNRERINGIDKLYWQQVKEELNKL